MNKKMDMMAKLSHEIRTPMNVIIGLSQSILSNDELPKSISDDIKNINTAKSINIFL